MIFYLIKRTEKLGDLYRSKWCSTMADALFPETKTYNAAIDYKYKNIWKTTHQGARATLHLRVLHYIFPQSLVIFKLETVQMSIFSSRIYNGCL